MTDRIGNATGQTAEHTTTFTYRTDMPHYLDAVVDPLGVDAAKTEYDADGRLSQITDANLQTVTMSYDLATRTQTVTDQLGKSGSIAFDERGNVTREVDQVGQTIVRSYDSASDRLLSETHVVGLIDDGQNGETDDLVTSFEYTELGLPKTQIDAAGLKTRYTYNASGQPTTVTDPLGNTTTNVYDDYDSTDLLQGANLLMTADANDNATIFEYDGRGLVTSIVTGKTANNFSYYDVVSDGFYDEHYDAACDPATDPACPRPGVTTAFEYNDVGDLTKTIDPQGNERQITYDLNGNQTGTSFTWINPEDANDTRLVATTNTLDANDRATSSSSPSGTSSTEYDSLDRPFRGTDEHGRISETLYDQRGLVIETRSVSEDELGNPVWLISRTVHDHAGRAIYTTNSHPENTPASEITGTHTLYDDAGRVTSTEQLVGVEIILVGQVPHLTSSLVSPGTVLSTSSTTYGSGNRVVETTDSFGRKTQTLYNALGQTIETRVETRRVSEGGGTEDVWLVSRTLYDDYGRVTLTTDQFVLAAACGLGACASPPIPAARTIYDAQGRAAKSQRLSDVIVEIVGQAPHLTSSLVSPGTILTSSQTLYDSRGRVSRSISSDNQTTDFEYDLQGRQIATVGHAVRAEDVGLGAAHAGKMVRHRTETQFNSHGQTFRQWSNIVQVEDADGNVLSIDRSAEQKTDFEHDEHGRVVKTIFGDGTFITSSYDTFGRLAAETNQLGHTKQFEYDGHGRLTAVVLPSVPHPETGTLVRPRYEYGYDARGNQTLIRDNVMQQTDGTVVYDHLIASGDDDRETLFTFDARGRQLTRTLPEGQTERFEYNERGQRTLHVSFEGVVTQFVYENTSGGSGRLIEQRFFVDEASYANGGGAPSEVWTYAFDAFGREAEVTQDRDGNLATTADQRITVNEHDAQGRLIEVATPEGTIHYEYDALGRRTRTWTGADEQSVRTDTRYVFDDLGRMSSVEVHTRNGQSLAAPEATDYVYDLIGNLDQVHLPNGVIADYDYNDLNQLELLRHFTDDNASGSYEAGVDTLLAEFDYDLRGDGKRTGVTEIDEQGNTTRIDWSYDDIGRLVRESFDSHNDSLDFIADYVFDLVGNRVEKRTDVDPTFSGNPTFDEVVAYLFDANDRLLIETLDSNNDGIIEQTTTYGYDQTQQTNKTVTDALTSQVSSLTTYVYNLQGRLSKVEIDADGDGSVDSTSEYAYDDRDMRVSQVVNGVTTLFLFDHHNPTGYEQVLEEKDGTGQLVRSYVLGLDVIAQAEADGTVYHLLYDGHGSTRALTDATGAIAVLNGAVQRFAYDAYGNAIGFDKSLAATTLLYSGEWFQIDIDQQYLRRRYYDPLTGRFSRKDPFFGNLHDPQSLHKYAYVHADPIQGIDPTGKFFTAQIGGLVHSVTAYVNNSRTAGVGLVVIDKAGTVADAVTIASLLAVGSSVPIPLLAGFLVSLIPGAGIAKLAGRGWDGLGAAGRLVFNAGGDLSSFLSHGGAGYLDEAGELLSDFLHKLGNFVPDHKLVEVGGELGAAKVAQKLGLEPVDDFITRYHGFDGLYRHGDEFVIVEAKGFSPGLSPALGQTKHGEQLSQQWIRRQADKLKSKGGEFAKWGEELQRHINAGTVKVLLTKTQVNKTLKEVGETAYELRNYADLGVDTYLPP